MASSEETYIYCVKLPFTCSSHAPDPFLAPFLPQYSVVKVGRSDDPARRLFEIMLGFKHFGSHQEWFASVEKGDKPVDVFYKGMDEDNVIFIQKCCNPGDAEDHIRSIIGYKLEQDFQDHFVQNLEQDKQRYIDQVGKTEWVLISDDKMKWIRGDYRSTWRASEFPTNLAYFRRDLRDNDPNGQEFVAKMAMLCWQHKGSSDSDHKVEIMFPPTKFHFTLTGPSDGLSSAHHVHY